MSEALVRTAVCMSFVMTGISSPPSRERVSMPSTFADLGVPADLVAVLTRRSIVEPFAIQAMTLGDALAGRDLCGRAPTGSGKTLAFGIAAVARLDGRAQPKRPLALVLTPTRELCAQVATELAPLATARGRRVASFYGGVGYQPQIKALSRGVDIAVACPGRLADLINGGHLRLSEVQVVVVDEADRMADMGFLPEVRRLLDQTPEDRQTMLFSATLDGDVDVLVRNYQRKPARHELELDEASAPNAEHFFWRVDGMDRVELAASVAAACGPTMIFCRTKYGADRIAKQLAGRGLRAAAIHGDRSQAQRERALASFAAGHVEALVATDVAARGIHVDGVAAVVHLDPPADAKDYVHRSGRTARAGATGVVISFVTPDKAGAVRKLQKDLGVPQSVTSPDLAAAGQAGGAPPGSVRPSAPARSSGPAPSVARSSGPAVLPGVRRQRRTGRPRTPGAAEGRPSRRSGGGSHTSQPGRAPSRRSGGDPVALTPGQRRRTHPPKPDRRSA
jgi:superfamily II DNA/RNA helicase